MVIRGGTTGGQERAGGAGYAKLARDGCESAQRTLDLLQECCGPWSPEQEAAFDAIRQIIALRCRPPGPPGPRNPKPPGGTTPSSGGAGVPAPMPLPVPAQSPFPARSPMGSPHPALPANGPGRVGRPGNAPAFPAPYVVDRGVPINGGGGGGVNRLPNRVVVGFSSLEF